jgi:hypothetical protein
MPRILVSTIIAVLLVYLIDFTAAGNTTCAGNLTQWYTNAVGETACEILPLPLPFLTFSRPTGTTYQRLRQICNQNCRLFFSFHRKETKYETLDLKIKSQTSEQMPQVINVTINCVRPKQIPLISVLIFMARGLLL